MIFRNSVQRSFITHRGSLARPLLLRNVTAQKPILSRGFTSYVGEAGARRISRSPWALGHVNPMTFSVTTGHVSSGYILSSRLFASKSNDTTVDKGKGDVADKAKVDNESMVPKQGPVDYSDHHHIITNYHPKPLRLEFNAAEKPLDTKALEAINVGVGKHRETANVSDTVAYGTVKFLRIFADAFFRKRYIHRAIVLETVAGCPGMVAAMFRHLTSLRRMRHDGGWINQLLAEAENERMHLMTFMKITNPTALERALVLAVQGVFFSFYSVVYVLFPKTAHRMVGYLEEEAVISYTQFLEEIDAGHIPNSAAPDIAIQYWRLAKDATLRDVVLAVRADEAGHRDANHAFADKLLLKEEDLRVGHDEK